MLQSWWLYQVSQHIWHVRQIAEHVHDTGFLLDTGFLGFLGFPVSLKQMLRWFPLFPSCHYMLLM